MPAVFKFVDDGTIFAKVNMYAAVERDYEREVPTHRKRDIATENVFNRTKTRAEAKGMKINVQKTAMMTVSDSRTFKPECYIEAIGGEILQSDKENIKILGFIFENRPSVATHVEETIKKTRRRYWVLRHLRRYGFDEKELVMVYQSLLRPVLEYCSVVYHSLLTGALSANIERVQYQALKCIYGCTGESYRTLLQKAGIENLETRRLKAIDNFTKKCLEGRFEGWFPLRQTTRTTRSTRPYEEKYARCDRLKNSPLYFMRRRLNDLAQENERRSAEEA